MITIPIEHHPLEPFLPKNARLLMLGSFPPQQKRWCMDFFHPNRTNPICHDIVCTGQKSFSVLTEDYGVKVPKMGEYNEFVINGREMRLWRMPSSSRAYPLPFEEKTAYYKRMMDMVLGG